MERRTIKEEPRKQTKKQKKAEKEVQDLEIESLIWRNLVQLPWRIGASICMIS